MIDYLIRFDRVTKYYQIDNNYRQVILNDFNLDICKNEFVLLKGPSGSGKSTILNLILGIEKPNSGRVLLRTNSLNNKSPDYNEINLGELTERELIDLRNKHFGIVSQFSNLDPLLDVRENVYYPYFLNSNQNDSSDFKKRADSVLEYLGVDKRKHHFPVELSSGEKQRVCICRALFNEPEVLIADEPTGNLDSTNTKMIFSLLWSLKEEKQITVIIASHDTPDLEGDIKQIKVQ
ncbi:MAG: ABC transporter ATP-binding protein [Candidatus Hodarchaeales archaeon]